MKQQVSLKLTININTWYLKTLKYWFVVSLPVGQEKIVRAFAEIMKNMSRMKTCVRPAMCKPYGKQSEALQKSMYLHLYLTVYTRTRIFAVNAINCVA
jgi:hypothetical protein